MSLLTGWSDPLGYSVYRGITPSILNMQWIQFYSYFICSFSFHSLYRLNLYIRDIVLTVSNFSDFVHVH